MEERLDYEQLDLGDLRNDRLTDNDITIQPFNAFLSGFSATVGQFVLTVSLRMQTNPENKADFESISHERYVDPIQSSNQ